MLPVTRLSHAEPFNTSTNKPRSSLRTNEGLRISWVMAALINLAETRAENAVDVLHPSREKFHQAGRGLGNALRAVAEYVGHLVDRQPFAAAGIDELDEVRAVARRDD